MSDRDESAVERTLVRARLETAAGMQYEVLRELGRGGMGHVFLARDRSLGREVALKVLPPVDALRPASLERFRREAESAAGLTHPHIVPIYGVGGDAESPYIAMAYIEGETLHGRLATGGPLPVPEALRITREIGGALAHAHRRGVIHRDVKPSNVLLERESGRALLSDFGLARMGAGDGLTISGLALGTPGYMAPEQAGGQSGIDRRADIYALGVLLCEMLTGRAFDAIDAGEWPVSAASVRRTLREVVPQLEPRIGDAIVRATAPRREDRFQSVEALLEALGLPAGSDTTPRPPAARRPARFVWHVLTALAVIGLARITWVVLQRGVVPEEGSLALMPFEGDTVEAQPLLPMLRYQLAGFAAVRVADPRVFAPVPMAAPTSEEVRAQARRAGAKWILYGLIGPAGSRREILVRAVQVSSGHALEIGRDTVDAISVAAADRIVLRLARSPVGRDIGLATGGGSAPASLEAVRAFTEAEAAFRRADYAAAVRGYDRVVELDTTFGLARYKRFLAALQEEPSEAALRAAVREMRRAVPRVGPQEQRLLNAYLVLFDSGDVAGAEQRLSELVRDDSTFLDGWFGLAEVRFHFGALAGVPAEAAERAFRKALALWPDAAPAIMHLVALDLFAGREVAARENIARYLAADSTSAVGRTVALGSRVLFGTVAEKRAILARLADLDDRVLEFGAINGSQVARYRDDQAAARLAVEEMTSPRRGSALRREGARFLVLSYAAEGRWREAERELARLRTELPGDGELARLPALLRGLRAPPPAVRDTAREIARLAASLARLDVPHVPFGLDASRWPERWRLAQLVLARGDTTAALRHLLAQDFLAAFSDQVMRGPAWLLKGRLLAARGRRDEAVGYLRRSASLLTYAEPPWEAVRDSARAELRKLGAIP